MVHRMESQKDNRPHYLDHRKRIKERFVKTGVSSFQDYEVLELLLTYALARKDVKSIAKELVARFKTFQGVLDAPLEELKSIKGIGEHTAILLKLTKDCSDFYLRGKILQNNVISRPGDLLNYCRSVMTGLGNEQFRVIFLNAKNEVLHDELLQEGTVDQTAVYPRKILEHALQRKATALIFVHNHPSGNPEPSSHDKTLTQSLVKVSDTLGIKVHDHIIIGKNRYFSFREEGLI